MKKVLKRCLRCTAFVLVFVLLLYVVSLALVPKDAKNDSGTKDIRANAVVNEPKDTIDAIFVGDSECYSTFVPLCLWEKYGITSYNCGTSSQNLYYSYEFLQKAFETQSPKVVFLETNAVYRDFSLGADMVHNFGRLFPVFTYHDRWKSLMDSIHEKEDEKNAVHIENEKGYVFKNGTEPAVINDYMKFTDKAAKISERNVDYVIQLKKFCEKNNAKLVLVSAPSIVNWNMKRHNGVRTLAEYLNLEYIDFNTINDQVKIDWLKDTRDKGDHLNYVGAVKATDWLGSYLESNGLCQSHKGEAGYEQWDEALETFYKDHAGDLK